MICPDCNGVGRVRKRFLLFFTRQARCHKCLGTGEFPPPVRKMAGPRMRYRDYDDDRWPSDRSTSTTIWPAAGVSDSGARADERLEIAGGGASGGAGGGASWDDSEKGDAPVIVDPFASEGSAIEAAAVADAIESDSGSSTSDDSSSDSSSDSGTSY